MNVRIIMTTQLVKLFNVGEYYDVTMAELDKVSTSPIIIIPWTET